MDFDFDTLESRDFFIRIPLCLQSRSATVVVTSRARVTLAASLDTGVKSFKNTIRMTGLKGRPLVVKAS